MSDEEYEDQNLDDFLLNAAQVLSHKNDKDAKNVREALTQHLNSNFKDEDEMANFFNTLNSVIFPDKDSDNGSSKKFSKEAFALYPIVFATSPRLSVKYIDYFLFSLQECISEENRNNFSFLSTVFDSVLNCFFIVNDSRSLTIKKKEMLYEKLLNFCSENIETNKRAQQSFGCLMLTELIEKCPLVKDEKKLDELFKKFSNYLEDRWFECKLDLLNCIISLIFTAEEKFRPYANVCLFRILDYLTDNDWMKRKLAINIVYTLVVYCKDEIMAVKENIIEFLNILKDDPVKEVREVCLQTLKFIEQADPEIYKPFKGNSNKNKSKSPNINSNRDDSDSVYHTDVNQLSNKKNRSQKKNNKSNLLNKSNNYTNELNTSINNTTSYENNYYKNNYKSNRGRTGLLYDNSAMMKKLEKERAVIKELEKKIGERRKKIGDIKLVNYKPKKKAASNIKKNMSAPNFYGKEEEISRENEDIKSLNIKSMKEEDTEGYEEQEKDYDEANQNLNLVLEQLTKIQEGQNNLMNMINILKNKVNENYITLNERITQLEKDFDDENIKNILGNVYNKQGVNEEAKYAMIENKFMKGKYNEALMEAVQNDKFLYRLLPLILSENLTRMTPSVIEDIISRLNVNLTKLCKGDEVNNNGNISTILSFYSQLIRSRVNLKLISQLNMKDTLRLVKSEYILKLSQNDINNIDIILKSLKV